jgi:hypothetical protein
LIPTRARAIENIVIGLEEVSDVSELIALLAPVVAEPF